MLNIGPQRRLRSESCLMRKWPKLKGFGPQTAMKKRLNIDRIFIYCLFASFNNETKLYITLERRPRSTDRCQAGNCTGGERIRSRNPHFRASRPYPYNHYRSLGKVTQKAEGWDQVYYHKDWLGNQIHRCRVRTTRINRKLFSRQFTPKDCDSMPVNFISWDYNA